MTLESVGEQWRRAVALGKLMSPEERKAENDKARLFATGMGSEVFKSAIRLRIFDRINNHELLTRARNIDKRSVLV